MTKESKIIFIYYFKNISDHKYSNYQQFFLEPCQLFINNLSSIIDSTINIDFKKSIKNDILF